MKKMVFQIMLILLVTLYGIVNAFSLTLTWDESITGDASEYRIYYGLNMDDLSFVNKVDSNTKEFSLNSVSLEEGKTYYFGVTAYNSAGESDLSNIVSYTPGDTTPPFPPTGVRVE